MAAVKRLLKSSSFDNKHTHCTWYLSLMKTIDPTFKRIGLRLSELLSENETYQILLTFEE